MVRIGAQYDERKWTIAFLTDTYRSSAGQWKDAEFSRATVDGRWAGGVEAIRRSLANRKWAFPSAEIPGVRVYDLPEAKLEEAALSANGSKDGKQKPPRRPSNRSRRKRVSRSALSSARQSPKR